MPAVSSSDCRSRFLARISFIASSMERVSRLLATGTGGAGGGKRVVGTQATGIWVPIPRHPRDPSIWEGLTTAVGLVGLHGMGSALPAACANEVAVLVLVVVLGTHNRWPPCRLQLCLPGRCLLPGEGEEPHQDLSLWGGIHHFGESSNPGGSLLNLATAEGSCPFKDQDL